MSTATQVLANRQNATRHGLTGAFSVLPHESQESFDQLAASLRDELRPEGQDETFLVDQMIQARWRLARIERFEAEAYEEILTSPNEANPSPDGRILAAMARSTSVLDKLLRYAADARRAYYKARQELQTTRARNQKAEANALDTYLRQVIFAPIPGEHERKAYDAAVHQFTKDTQAKSAHARAAGPLDNPALRL